MPFTYTIVCGTSGCTELAQYKIASRWTDGITEELKTYGLACREHAEDVFQLGLEKQKKCRLAQGESLEVPQIFQLVHGKYEDFPERIVELEEKFQEKSEE